MNLETFKARARRKLELPPRRSASDAARTTQESSTDTNTATRPEQRSAPTVQNPGSNTDKFAAALSHAHNKELERGTVDTEHAEKKAAFTAPSAPSTTTTPIASAPTTSAPTAYIPGAYALESSSEEPTSAPLSAYAQPGMQHTDTASEASELSRLRSLLLGDSHQNQQDQVNAVYERTQKGINDLRQDMDARLDNLTKYVGQLEQSILNSVEVRAKESDQQQWSVVAETTEARVQEHNERIDALDAKLTNTLSNLRAEFETDRETDRAFLKKELSEANARTDKLLDDVSGRLETSIASIEARLSKQLTTQSIGLVADSESSVSNLRAQLGNLIDDRVRSFNDKQSTGIGELRDILLSNTQQLNGEIKSQTEQQRNTLNAHRSEMEKQLNSAINELNQSKVSHKDLALLLGRLADRLKHL